MPAVCTAACIDGCGRGIAPTLAGFPTLEFGSSFCRVRCILPTNAATTNDDDDALIERTRKLFLSCDARPLPVHGRLAWAEGAGKLRSYRRSSLCSFSSTALVMQGNGRWRAASNASGRRRLRTVRVEDCQLQRSEPSETHTETAAESSPSVPDSARETRDKPRSLARPRGLKTPTERPSSDGTEIVPFSWRFAMLCSALPLTATSLSASSRCRDTVSLISQMAPCSAVVARVNSRECHCFVVSGCSTRRDGSSAASNAWLPLRRRSLPCSERWQFPPPFNPALSFSRRVDVAAGCCDPCIHASMHPEIPSRSRMHLDHMHTPASAVCIPAEHGGYVKTQLPACFEHRNSKREPRRGDESGWCLSGSSVESRVPRVLTDFGSRGSLPSRDARLAAAPAADPVPQTDRAVDPDSLAWAFPLFLFNRRPPTAT